MRVSNTLPALALVVASLCPPPRRGRRPWGRHAHRRQPGRLGHLGESSALEAGNTNKSPSRTDALGPTAYFDNAGNTGEQIPGCHRSKAAEVHLGGGIASKNLACSGARTTTSAYDPESNFKPGIDFYDDGAGHIGQAKALAARRHAQRQGGHVTDRREQLPLRRHRPDLRDRLAHVTVVVEELLRDDSMHPPCSAPSNIATQTANIKTAILNVRTAMSSAGYADSSYSILVSTYWNPIPRGSGFRYPETGYTPGDRRRGVELRRRLGQRHRGPVDQRLGEERGRGLGLSNVKVLDMQTLMDGHRLCEKTVSLLEEKGPDVLDPGRRGRHVRVVPADPYRDRDLPAVPAAGGRARELRTSSRCATVSARPTTAAPPAPASASPPAASPPDEPNVALNWSSVRRALVTRRVVIRRAL